MDCVDGQCKYACGYVINNGEVYAYTYDEKGEKVTSTLAVSSCTSSNVGKFITGGTAVCINENMPVALNSNSKLKHMILEASSRDVNTPFSNLLWDIAVKHGENYFITDEFEISKYYKKNNN